MMMMGITILTENNEQLFVVNTEEEKQDVEEQMGWSLDELQDYNAELYGDRESRP
uniref:Uncharacterized protein n=1 Tax=Moniliophthora roreri TaxID=221103 RepID=A0A0W0G7B8_MONRR